MTSDEPWKRGCLNLTPFLPFFCWLVLFLYSYGITLQITGGKKQSDEGAALFAVRVHGLVSRGVIALSVHLHNYISRALSVTSQIA